MSQALAIFQSRMTLWGEIFSTSAASSTLSTTGSIIAFWVQAYEQRGRFDEAIETFKSGLKLEGNIELWAGLGHAYAAYGNKTDALKVLDHLEKAFEWLNRAVGLPMRSARLNSSALWNSRRILVDAAARCYA